MKKILHAVNVTGNVHTIKMEGVRYVVVPPGIIERNVFTGLMQYLPQHTLRNDFEIFKDQDSAGQKTPPNRMKRRHFRDLPWRQFLLMTFWTSQRWQARGLRPNVRIVFLLHHCRRAAC